MGDPLSVDIGNTLSGLATAHEQLGDHEMAVLLLKRVRNIWTKQYGAHDKRLTTVLPAMATYAMLDSDYATAQDCYRQLVNIEEAAGPAESAHLGSALEALASSLAYVGKLAEAEPIAERAVSVLTEANDTPTSIDSANANLQYIEQRLGKASPAPAAPTAADVAESSASVKDTNSLRQIAAKQVPMPVSTAANNRRQTTTKQAAQLSTGAKNAISGQQIVSKQITQKPVSAAATDSSSTNETITTKQVTGVLLASKTTGDQKIKPWELPSTNKQLIASKQQQNDSTGKIQYLAGGRLISPEQYKAMMLAKDAYELIRDEKYTMAIEILKNALATYPDLVAHANLGLAYTQIGQNSDAVSHLRQAIAIDATRAPAWLNLASAFQMNGQLKEAVATYGEFVQRFPNQPLAAKHKKLRHSWARN